MEQKLFLPLEVRRESTILKKVKCVVFTKFITNYGYNNNNNRFFLFLCFFASDAVVFSMYFSSFHAVNVFHLLNYSIKAAFSDLTLA